MRLHAVHQTAAFRNRGVGESKKKQKPIRGQIRSKDLLGNVAND